MCVKTFPLARRAGVLLIGVFFGRANAIRYTFLFLPGGERAMECLSIIASMNEKFSESVISDFLNFADDVSETKETFFFLVFLRMFL